MTSKKEFYEKLLGPKFVQECELDRAIKNGTAYEQFGYDPNGFHKKEAEQKNYEYEPGIHTRMYRGTAAHVNYMANAFHTIMYNKYANYTIINVNTVQLADSTAMYITFKV